jgi:formylglycine-generating enzyme
MSTLYQVPCRVRGTGLRCRMMARRAYLAFSRKKCASCRGGLGGKPWHGTRKDFHRGIAPRWGGERASGPVGTRVSRRYVLAALLAMGGVAAASATESDAVDKSLEHRWTLHDGKHWQADSPDKEDPASTEAIEQTGGSCPIGMVEVRGRMKVDPAPYYLEALQALSCHRWLNRDFPERCGEFDRAKWLALLAPIDTVGMTYCIDRYEYPNTKGQFPWVFVTWTEAADLCADQGKRLCTEDEWTLACEGEEAWPYPYGYTRSEDACLIDRPARAYDESAWSDRSSVAAMMELDRVWQGEPSGSRAACRSPFGVYDMTGNVDEWTVSTASRGYRSILKGGYWGQVRNRCRVSTRAHGESFAFYQQGFRCCASPD